MHPHFTTLTKRWGTHGGTRANGCTTNTNNQDSIGWSDWDNNDPANANNYQCELTALHSKLSNFLFYGGHVKSINPVATTGFNAQPNMWGCMNGNVAGNAQYPACTPGDINGDAPDDNQQKAIQAHVNNSP